MEFLRHTGASIEEMLETSHHALVQYRLPTTGEIVPLLQIAPSKTDQERVLLVNLELADVLAAIVRRVRDPRTGAIPLLAAYDYEERIWNPPAPQLFQWDRAGEPSRMSGEFIRRALAEVLAFIGLTDTTGRPMDFAPHDFRRMFITDAIRSGLPPHIAQVIVGHTNINTTRGYNASTPPRPSKPTAPSSSAAAPCAPPRSTTPPLKPSGRTSSATSNAASSRSAPAPAHTAPPACTSTPAPDARSFDLTRPNGRGLPRSATT
ncbi:site-specific integrase [Streptomyces avermitilis]|uniref:site-specific integrase n=1 Tax=Streptomyces avermitilis TaxID=33903 RepID=UPI0033DC2F05